MERRSFIKNISLAIGASLLMPGSLFSSENNEDQLPWMELLDYARLAPSPHNLQPWKIKVISDTEAELYYDPIRLLPVGDKGHRFMAISMGIFIETLSIAASNYKYELLFEYNGVSIDHEQFQPTCFGKLKFVKSSPKIEFEKELIKQRKTSRLHFKPIVVEETIVDKLKFITKKFDHELITSNDDKKVKAVLELNRETLFHDLNNDAIREELKKCLRYSKEEAETTKDGLWSHCMNFPGKLMRNFFNNPQFYNHGLVKKILDRYYIKSMKGTKTIAWIKGATEGNEERINTGRMLVQLWLELTRNKVYMHPFGSVITNTSAHSKLASILELKNGLGDTWLLMRIGYSEEPPSSYRLNTNSIILKS